MPSRWSVALRGPMAVDVPVEAPHAVVSRWLDDDHKASVKPYAVSPPIDAAEGTVLVVRLLDDALGALLRERVVAGATVRLGRHFFTVVSDPEETAATAWQQLGEWTGARAWEVAFRSPTTFRNRARTSPWPSPDSVVTSLASRWDALSPVEIPAAGNGLARALWVSDVEGQSEALRLRQTVVSGFVGRIRYVCDGSDAAAGALDALFGFARFAGIGSHTAFGLGTVRVGSTWQPARKPAG